MPSAKDNYCENFGVYITIFNIYILFYNQLYYTIS